MNPETGFLKGALSTYNHSISTLNYINAVAASVGRWRIHPETDRFVGEKCWDFPWQYKLIKFLGTWIKVVKNSIFN